MLKKLQKREEGFTLAELLIVVAIIAVLVAIAIPIFTTQLEKSKETTDIANLRAAYAAGTVAAMTGFAGELSVPSTSTLYYNPNVDGSLSTAGIKLGQGTATDGHADTTALSGGVMSYATSGTDGDVRSKSIVVQINSGVLSSVKFG